jgi:membrane fusion protein (multidrug efflux system)
MQSYREQIAKGLLRTRGAERYTVEVILVDGSVYPYTGQITFAEPSYNAQTGTFLIRASVKNPKGVLRPNQYVRVRLKGAIRPKAILGPQRAVQQGSRGHFVWIVGKDDKAEQRPVVVGGWRGNYWFISEGLRSGDQVVVDGGLTLRPGMPVSSKPYESERESGKPSGISPKSDAAKVAK